MAFNASRINADEWARIERNAIGQMLECIRRAYEPKTPAFLPCCSTFPQEMQLWRDLHMVDMWFVDRSRNLRNPDSMTLLSQSAIKLRQHIMEATVLDRQHKRETIEALGKETELLKMWLVDQQSEVDDLHRQVHELTKTLVALGEHLSRQNIISNYVAAAPKIDEDLPPEFELLCFDESLQPKEA